LITQGKWKSGINREGEVEAASSDWKGTGCRGWAQIWNFFCMEYKSPQFLSCVSHGFI